MSDPAHARAAANGDRGVSASPRAGPALAVRRSAPKPGRHKAAGVVEPRVPACLPLGAAAVMGRHALLLKGIEGGFVELLFIVARLVPIVAEGLLEGVVLRILVGFGSL